MTPADGTHAEPRGKRPLWTRIAGGLIIGSFLTWLLSAALVVLWGSRDSAPTADAIVVLGAAQYAGRPSPVLRARLDHAIELFRAGKAPKLILTGGMGTGDTTSEAAASARYVKKLGIPDSVIMLEPEGRTTVQSLRAVAAMMQERRMESAILVSDPFHMLRLRILAARLGVNASTSPTRTSPIAANREQEWGYVFSESVKVPFALFFDRIN
jgi:uncharacterized SAM-binding protein YcdF (DUF218 family)